jgi:hypothetical protein
MKRFLSAVGLCLFLMLFGLYAFLPTSRAENNILLNLLNLPAPPPPNPLFESDSKPRDENFFSRSKPPKDDAPVKDLMAYWKYQNQFNAKYTYAPKISEESLKRVLGEIEKNPESLPDLINVLPKDKDTAETVKRYYDQEVANRNYERAWRDTVKKWLVYNSSYFSAELAETAGAVAETPDYVTNQDEVLALARVDWEKARPLLERLLNDGGKPVSQTLARWAFYEHALQEGNAGDIEKYRRELQATVENRGEGAGNRDLAMDALVEAGDFEGRDDWYYSLLSDETLFELRVGGRVFTGLTTLLNHSLPEKYVGKMLELVKSDNQAVRNAAARNLSTLIPQKNPEIIMALVPWLENPKWAKEVNGERRTLLGVMDSVEIPESVPGLIAMLNEKETREVSAPGMSNTNTYSANTYSGGGTGRQVEYYPYRYGAINALAAQKDARAIPALRLLLPQVEEYERRLVIRALLWCGGYSVPEQVEALEFVARNGSRLEPDDEDPPKPITGNVAVGANVAVLRTGTNTAYGEGAVYISPSRIPVSIDMKDARSILGGQLIERTEPDRELIAALLERLEVLDKKEPNVASALRKIIRNWRGAAVNSMMLKDLKNNKTDVDAVVKLLSLRRELKEKQFEDVSDIRGGGALALGISACLTEDNGDYDAILAGENVESKIAMLGCARLIRARLPVGEVAKNLQSPNKLLALAAERYLESEDSPEARMRVLALHPNEAVILGARSAFLPDNAPVVDGNFLRELFISVDEAFASMPYYFDFEDLAATGKKLQKEVKENQELLGIYAYDKNFIRIYRDKAVFSWEQDVSRYRSRVLSKEEFDAFKSYLASERVDELSPFLSFCEGCEPKELVMLGRGGGRRVFWRANDAPKFFGELEKMFEEMRKPPAKLYYWLQKDIGGLEILFENENLQARAVWKNGDDFRLLIDNETRRAQIDRELEKQEEDFEESEEYDYDKAQQLISQRREQRKFENLAWYKFESSKLSDLISQPPGIEFIPARDALPGSGRDRQWKARAANFEIRADEEGLYKITGGRATKIRAGYYMKPLVTPNGRWAIAVKYEEENPFSLVRVNLLTNREFKIQLEPFPTYEAVAFIPAINKVLIVGGAEGEEYMDAETKTNAAGEYFLLDVETGAVQAAKGEIRPLAQQTFRALQPTANPNEFWAAIPDAEKNETLFGVYNSKTLAFKSLIKLPQIAFDSMNMWVDEKESKIYFVYEGHLLGLPLPKVK